MPWTEAWAFSLVEGTPQSPQRVVVSYQKVAGTGHIERECGSYVLQSREDGTTDLSLYEEVKAAGGSPRTPATCTAGSCGTCAVPMPPGRPVAAAITVCSGAKLFAAAPEARRNCSSPSPSMGSR